MATTIVTGQTYPKNPLSDSYFSPALNVGSKDHRYIKKPHHYMVKDNIVTGLPERKIPTVFPDHQEEGQQFVKKNSPDLSREGHLIELLDYYNSLSRN